jgi:hypothetical protein
MPSSECVKRSKTPRRRSAGCSRPRRRGRHAGCRRRRGRSFAAASVSVVARHDVAGAGDGLVQRVVVALVRRLRELDVVGDRARAGAAQAVDRLGVQAPRERPLAVEVGERDVVDGDDDHVVGPVRVAGLEAQRDRVGLDAGQQVRGLADDADHRGDHPGHEDRGDVRAARAAESSRRLSGRAIARG